MKNGAPKVPKKVFGGLPGSPWDGPGTSVSLRQNEGIRKNDRYDATDTRKQETRTCARVVNKRPPEKRSKSAVFKAPPWPESGFC
jgi:hypothetical protein